VSKFHDRTHVCVYVCVPVCMYVCGRFLLDSILGADLTRFLGNSIGCLVTWKTKAVYSV